MMTTVYLKLLEMPASPPFTTSMFPALGAGMAGPPVRISSGNRQVVLDTSVHPLVVNPLMVRPSVWVADPGVMRPQVAIGIVVNPLMARP